MSLVFPAKLLGIYSVKERDLSSGVPYLLFDLERDPTETTNLVSDESNREMRDDLRLKILEHLVQTQVRLDRPTVDTEK